MATNFSGFDPWPSWGSEETPAVPLALGAMPNSSLEPSVVQQALGIAPSGGGFPDVRVLQGAPQMPQMGFLPSPGLLAQSHNSPLAGLSAPQIHAMLAGGQMPSLQALQGLGSAGNAAGGQVSRGTSGTGGAGGGIGTGSGQTAIGIGGAGLIGNLGKLLSPLIKAGSNLFPGFDLGTGGTAGGDPLGTGASATTSADITRPVDSSTYFAGDPEAGLAGADLGTGMPGIEPSDWSLGSQFNAEDPMLFNPSIESGAEGLGTAAADTAGGGLGLSSLSGALGSVGPVLGLINAIRSGNPTGALESLPSLASSISGQFGGPTISSLGGDAISSLADALGIGAGAAGAGTAAGIGPLAAGGALASEGGGFGGAAAGGAGLGGLGAALGLEVGLGPLALALAPIAGWMMAPQAANSPTGFRPAGWSKMVSAQRTQQSHVSDVVDTALTNLAQDPKSDPAQAMQLLTRLGNPDDPVNRDFFGKIDHDLTGQDQYAGWGPGKGQSAIGNIKTLYDTYKDQLDPVTQAKVALTINARMPGVVDAPKNLTPEQLGQLSYEQQLSYRDLTDPGWRDAMLQAMGPTGSV